MSGVRDPAFWRRFSMAVHLDDEEKGAASSPSGSTPSRSRPQLKHSDSWLARQQQKRSRRTCICWVFWLCFFSFVAGIVILILWLKSSGLLDYHKAGSTDGNPSSGNS